MAIQTNDPESNSAQGKMRSRRDFINKAAGGMVLLGAAGTGTFAAGAQNNNSATADGRKLKIVISGGHPGDPEYGCGGTIAGFTAAGHEVVLLYLNRGEAGIAGKSYIEAGRIRTAEAMQACKILGARAAFASQTDGQAVVDAAHYKEFEELLEKEDPDIIFTQWPVDNHPDHRAVASLVYNSWQKLKKSRSANPPVLYYYEVSNGEDTLMFTPNYYIDITEAEPLKKKACLAHASQAPEKFYPLQDQVSRFRGLESGCTLAEAFIMQVHSMKSGDLLPT